MEFNTSRDFANHLDATDELSSFRDQFRFPSLGKEKETLYLNGNSLGLQPKKVSQLLQEELDEWGKYGVLGHVRGKRPWYPYHELFTEGLCHVTGAKPSEVAAMNTLTTNLHLQLVSFYRPSGHRTKILAESDCFPSDRFAFESQIRFHGLDPHEHLALVEPRSGERCLHEDDIIGKIHELGSSLDLVLLGNVNYLTGQAFNIRKITQAAHSVGARCGWDLAHGIGNLKLELHEDGPDFAVWCHYKYLNSGPGAVAGIFVHERHHGKELPRLSGWWSHDKSTRMKMSPDMVLMAGAEGWALSNPPIFSLTPLLASLELFQSAEISKLEKKRIQLNSYLEYLLKERLGDAVRIITPKDRGAQLSLEVSENEKLSEHLENEAVICDFRMPNIVRLAPAPLYNSYSDVFEFVERFKGILN